MQRICYLALGHFSVAMGVIGLIVPGIPGVVFFLIAAWAYGRSSPYFREKLVTHPHIGQAIQDWEAHRVVPRKVKILATAVMSVSWGLCVYFAHGWVSPTVMGVCIVAVLAYLYSKPSVYRNS